MTVDFGGPSQTDGATVVMPVAPCFLLQATSRPRWRRKTKRSPRTPGIRSRRYSRPSKTFDHLERVDREQRHGAERRKPRADPEHQRNRHRGFRNGSDVDPYLGRVETSLGKKARGRRRHRAGYKFPHHVRKEKQAADDPEDVQPVGEIKILGLDTEIFFCRSHLAHRPANAGLRLQSRLQIDWRTVGASAHHKKSDAPFSAPDQFDRRPRFSTPPFATCRYATLGALLRELRWKNSAWLATAETIAGWNGFEIRNAGSGRSPVRKRSG